MNVSRGYLLACAYLLLLALSHALQSPAPPIPESRGIQRFALPGGRLSWFAYRDEGPRGQPVVLLLHGSPGAADDLSRVSAALSRQYRTITPDLLCAGYSDRRAPDCGARAQAQALLRFLDKLGVDRFWIFAHSFGGAVAIELADRAPRRTLGMVQYGALGIQEAEGSGDYSFEHFKYHVAYAVLAVGLDLIPHFGLFGDSWGRHGFLKQFMDTDQRPMATTLQRLNLPTLWIHGDADPLVPAWAAEKHAQLVRNSDLYILQGSHFLVFNEAGSHRLGGLALDFFGRRTANPEAPARIVRESVAHLQKPDLPIALNLDPSLSAWARMLAIIAATFVSEDLTCIAAGLLVHAGRLDAISAVFACFVGIFLGDLGLYGLGRLVGAGLARIVFVQRRLPKEGLEKLRARFNREGWKLVILSRFVPGMRFPVYTGAGILGGRAAMLAVAALIAGLIWTPLLVLSAAFFGPKLVRVFEAITGPGWAAIVAAVVVLFFALRFTVGLFSAEARRKLLLRLDRLRRPEFWPPWLFYAPLIPWCAYLHLRVAGFRSVTASNPAIEYSGLIGESKSKILVLLPARWTLRHAFITAQTDAALRLDQARRLLAEREIDFPLIAKPDVGEKGVGVRLLHNEEQLANCLSLDRYDLILQQYHPGPHEAGVFYYRYPGRARGEILAITDKIFPILEGDGEHDLETLIRRHPRFRLQESVFLARFAGQEGRVLKKGETLQLAQSGNHYQGCRFRDGTEMITPALHARFDEISQAIPGFYFGRYDVRFSDRERFLAGEDFAIIELNGATSEATVIYDPEYSIARIYSTLFRQWRILFEIGWANRQRGATAMSNFEIIAALYRRWREESRPERVGA